MMEHEIQIVAHCPRCGIPVDAWLNEVPVADITAESAHDAEEVEEIELDCEKCGFVFSVTIRAHLAGWDAFLTEDPSEQATLENYTYGDWIDDIEPEPHPHTNFQVAIAEWRSLLETLADKGTGDSAINRMLLVQLFSTMEAYLADAIIKLAYEDAKIAASIVKWHPELRKQQVSISRIAAEPNLLRDIVVAQLRKTQFHRFDFVHSLLKASLAHHFLPADKALRDILLGSVKLRHNCVHRNGRDETGKVPIGLTVDYLADVATHFVNAAASLSDKISKIGT